ncbi:hypothetical protein LCGC14_1842370, partial [marine sediment metagenome]
MTDKPVDPLAGVEAVRLCTKCHWRPAACKCNPDTPIDDYLHKPAVRKAMVEWLR